MRVYHPVSSNKASVMYEIVGFVSDTPGAII